MFPFTATDLQAQFGTDMYRDSLVIANDAALWLQRTPSGKYLTIAAPSNHAWLTQFSDQSQSSRSSQSFSDGYALNFYPTNHANARSLMTALPYLKPVPLGLAASAGCGDRLGLATPGHVQAFHAVAQQPGAHPIAAIFAQQSIREMNRTHRSPDDVLCDATWGAFEAGWSKPVGADADHLKTTEDINACVAAGYSFFTFDPGLFVDSEADSAPPTIIQQKVAALPWSELASSPEEMRQRYENHVFELEDRHIVLDAESLWRAAAKYGKAINHVAFMYRHLASCGIPFELEISVDETETPTTHGEHLFIVSELQRLGVHWISLAPRYIGRFEKGVDYIGDLHALQADLAGHAAIARAFGPYKLSLHSGSDKFSVYPLIVSATRGVVHLKTAGTSYVEALRVIAAVNIPLFRDLYAYAYECYMTDRASYHVSAELSRVPPIDTLSDAQLPAVLDQFDTRQMLHVTFGSVLARFGNDLQASLRIHEEAYYTTIEQHFVKHLRPFAQV
ncbi:MAG TPA: tagaturonate epimerase family protein [Ktedonobacteraceae bacterium]|nr:tagaturonate epimerase family protein [Ktedonobacteraceae bacterium]